MFVKWLATRAATAAGSDRCRSPLIEQRRGFGAALAERVCASLESLPFDELCRDYVAGSATHRVLVDARGRRWTVTIDATPEPAHPEVVSVAVTVTKRHGRGRCIRRDFIVSRRAGVIA